MSLPDTPNLSTSWCPGCRPEVDPTQVIVQIRWCDTHEPSRVGADDEHVLLAGPYLSGTAEAGGESNRLWCEFVHSGGVPAV